MISCSEFTGVPLIAAQMAGADFESGQVRAGRGRRRLVDDAHHPDGLVEAGGCWSPLRPRTARCCAPENGYPLRLVVAGRAGRELGRPAPHRGGRQPYGAKDEAIPLHRPDARRPAPPVHQHPGAQERHHHALGRPGAAGKGFYNITAWPGRGAARSEGRRVLGRRRAQLARRRLETPVLDKCADALPTSTGSGTASPAMIQSRATDETGYVQPTYRKRCAPCAGRA